MIFILHYILFGGALPPVAVLMSIYLKTYSSASMSEIGALLKIPAFLTFLLKPIICGFADRYQAHKFFLMGALACMVLGFGSLTVAPFFPHIIATHGRLLWYFNIVGVVLGSSGLGLVWSIGDALAINGAEMKGISWEGSYRLWSLVGYGSVGALVGPINEIAFLPRFVPGMFLLVFLLTCEIVLLSVWPNRHFVMYGNLREEEHKSLEHIPELPPHMSESNLKTKIKNKEQESAAKNKQQHGDTQVALLKLIARRDKLVICYVILFTIIGFSFNGHLAYFYMHVQQVCQATGVPYFSLISSGMIAAHSIFEFITFLMLPRLTRLLGGRTKLLTLCCIAYFLFQLYHGTYMAELSIYYVILAESVHGITAAVVYTLVADLGLDIVNRVDNYLPELIERKLVEPDVEITELKSRLRATMHGLLGGALDGLGGGLGTLVGGIILDYAGFPTLWRLCASLSLCVALFYPLAERRALQSMQCDHESKDSKKIVAKA